MGRGEGGGHTRTVGAGGGTSAGRARVTPPAATAATSAATSHLSPQTAAAAEANAALLGLTPAQFVAAFEVSHGGLRSRITGAARYGDGGSVTGVLHDGQGRQVGSFSRSFSDNGQTAYNAYFSINPSHQNSGFGAQFIGAQFNAYSAGGKVKTMGVTPGLSEGPAVWPKMYTFPSRYTAEAREGLAGHLVTNHGLRGPEAIAMTANMSLSQIASAKYNGAHVGHEYLKRSRLVGGVRGTVDIGNKNSESHQLMASYLSRKGVNVPTANAATKAAPKPVAASAPLRPREMSQAAAAAAFAADVNPFGPAPARR